MVLSTISTSNSLLEEVLSYLFPASSKFYRSEIEGNNFHLFISAVRLMKNQGNETVDHN